MRRFSLPGLLALLLVLVAPVAGAEVLQEIDPRVAADWSRGVLRATAAAVADLSAPNPGIARVRAERIARERAQELLRAALRKLPLAGEKQGESAPRVVEVLADAVPLEVEYGSDGSTVVTMAVGLEALRSAYFGALQAPAAAADGPTALLVDARHLVKAPSLGLRLAADGKGGEAGPAHASLFFRTGEVARKDARLGGRIEEARASKLGRGTVVVADGALVERARKSGALVVFLIGAP